MRVVGQLRSFVLAITLSHLRVVRGEEFQSAGRGVRMRAAEPAAQRTTAPEDLLPRM